MGSDSDDLVSLPNPPPPRPAARRKAIETALSKFDGIESVSAPRRRFSLSQWASTHRAAAGGLVTAALVAVIAVPAIQVALRDNAPGVVSDVGPSPSSQPAPPAAGVAPVNQPPLDRIDEAVAGAETPAPAQAVAPPSLAEDRAAPAPMMSDRKPAAEAPVPIMSKSVPAPAMAAPPPPPPPPPPEAEREAYAADSESLVVTGSRIPQSNLARQKSAAGRADEASSPLAVIDPYGEFLSRLQAGLRATDRRAVLRLVAVPLRVNFGGEIRTYRSRQDIERDYANIFTPAVRQAVLTLRPDTLGVRDEGRLRGNGRIWFGCGAKACSTESSIKLRELKP